MRTEWKMRKTILFLAGIIFILCNISIAQALEYEVIQITDNDETSEFYMERYPAINNNGQITWISCNDYYHWGDCVRMYSDGVTTSEISAQVLNRFVFTGWAELYSGGEIINDSGDVVWGARQSEDPYSSYNISLYNGTETLQHTDSGMNYSPVINNSGQIAWHSDGYILFYDGTNTINLGRGKTPHINDQGQVVWISGTAVRFYDGTNIITLGQAHYSGWPAINNNGQVAWGDSSSIYLYDGSTTNIIATGMARSPLKLNDQGQVAWLEDTGYVTIPTSHNSLFFYDGSTTTKITDNVARYMMGLVFDLNNQGHLVWIQNNTNAMYTDWSVFIYDGTSNIRLHTSKNYDFMQSLNIDMNDHDDVVWGLADDNDDGEIYLAKGVPVNQSPTANAGLDIDIECATSSGTSVTLEGSASIDPDGDPLSHTWSGPFGTETGEIITVDIPLGTHIITLTVDDGNGGTDTDMTVITVEDTTAPVTSIDSIIGTEGENSWYISDVDLNLSATDTCTGVKRIHYTVNAAETIVMGAAASFSITEDGIYTVTYWAEDNAGNIEAIGSLPVQREVTSPVTTPTVPTPGAGGYYDSCVDVQLSTDSGSSGTSVTQYSYDGVTWYDYTGQFQVCGDGGTQVHYRAGSNAGNVETPNIITINIDKTLPVISYTLTPSPNAAGWNSGTVTVSFDCADETSGIASCTAPVTVSTEGDNQTVIGRAVDTAGNEDTVSVTLNIDLTDPTITASVTPVPNGYGWHNSIATVNFECNDDLSGIDQCPQPISVTVQGANQEITGTAIDIAGRQATATVYIDLDTTAPSITIGGIADGQEYALGLVPTASYSVTDNLSGVLTSNAELSGGDANGLGEFTYIVSAEDYAGNTSNDDPTTYTVIASIGGTTALIDQYVADPDISDDLNDELVDAQADIDNGSYDQAIQDLDQFKQDVDKEKDKGNISTEAAAVLTAAANYMIQDLQGMQ